MIKSLNGLTIRGKKIVVMDELKNEFPDKFDNKTGAMDYPWFEKNIRPHNFIYVRNDAGSLSFTMADADVDGSKGCDVADILCCCAVILDAQGSASDPHGKIRLAADILKVVKELDNECT